MTSWVDPHPFIESIHTLRFESIHTLLSRSTPFWEEGCGSTQDVIDGPHCIYKHMIWHAVKCSWVVRNVYFSKSIFYGRMQLKLSENEMDRSKVLAKLNFLFVLFVLHCAPRTKSEVMLVHRSISVHTQAKHQFCKAARARLCFCE